MEEKYAELFAQAGDIRKYDIQYQNFLLQKTFPADFDIRYVEPTLKHVDPKLSVDPKFVFNNSWNVATMIIRHIYHCIPPRHRGYAEGEEDKAQAARVAALIKEQEDNFPFLRFTWVELSRETWNVQSAIRYLIQKEHDPLGQMKAIDILESPELLRSLWCRDEFQLQSPYWFVKDKDKEEWHLEIRNNLMENEVLRWDGSVPLADYIHTKFRTLKSTTGRLYINRWNNPNIIRVRYEHTSTTAPFRFDALRRLVLSPDRLVEKSRKGALVDLEIDKTDYEAPYTLIAVVLCARAETERDMIRLYNVFGMPEPFSVDLEGMAWLEGDIGDPGRAYMLFYAHGPPQPLVLRDNRPVATPSPRIEALRAMMRGSIEPRVGEPPV
ncbi:hypothetical protein GGS20DRAFT_557791 [Poronia punctata]|nr:hypothetical protein GGS20DRAFT_557791 [Poronia punctata]